MLAKRIPKGFFHTAPVSLFYRRVPSWRLLPKCICKTYIWILFIHKTDGKVRSKEEKYVQKKSRPVQKSPRWKPEISWFSIPHNRNIKSNVLWTACHVQFLKQNISYCVSVSLFSHFPTAFCWLFALFNFKESKRPLIVSLPIPFLFFILLELLFPNGISRAASPQGSLSIICCVLSSFCKIQALSLAIATNFSSCGWLTFLLILRSCSKGFQI